MDEASQRIKRVCLRYLATWAMGTAAICLVPPTYSCAADGCSVQYQLLLTFKIYFSHPRLRSDPVDTGRLIAELILWSLLVGATYGYRKILRHPLGIR